RERPLHDLILAGEQERVIAVVQQIVVGRSAPFSLQVRVSRAAYLRKRLWDSQCEKHTHGSRNERGEWEISARATSFGDAQLHQPNHGFPEPNRVSEVGSFCQQSQRIKDI